MVTYSLTGSANATTDYTDPQAATITIPAGNTTATVNINVVNDNTPEPTKNITLTLLTANNGFSVVSTPAVSAGSGWAVYCYAYFKVRVIISRCNRSEIHGL